MSGANTHRLATAADRDRVRAMVLSAFEPISWMRGADAEFGPFNGLDWRARFARRVDPFFDRADGIVLISEESGGEREIAAAALGSVDLVTGVGSVEFLAVNPAAQGRGHGRATLRAMLRHFASLGATTATLECLTNNAPALALYRSEGWTEVATQVRFFRRLDGILEQ